MSGKRPKKVGDNIPSKKSRVEETNENIDVSNLQSQSSQLVLSREQSIDPLLKSGKITKICLKNFMCHSNFQVDLNHQVNVFVGLNGSGKSAILTALAIGLGSSARSTSRSTNLKDLVKTGETSASIEITLTNDGIDSFEENVYGKRITIVRHINGNSGASNFKLKNESGRVVTSMRQDLTKLTLCLNIQVENPVLLLNQDAARSFLKECDPKKLYILFLKATQIESIIDTLHSCLTSSTASKSQLDHLNRSIKHYDNEVCLIKLKQERLQSVDKLRREIVAYKNEFDWLQVSKEEANMANEEAELKKIQATIAEITDLVKHKAKHDRQLKEKVRDYGTEYQRLVAVVEEKDRELQMSRGENETKKCQLSAHENTHRLLVERKQQYVQNIQQLQDAIAERSNNPLNGDTLRKENEMKIELLQKKLQDLTLIQNNARRDLEQFNETYNDIQERLESAKIQHVKTKELLQTCIQKKLQLGGPNKDPLQVYGQSMPKLIKLLEKMYNEHKFTEMPIGPLGRYVEVPEKKYRSAVENILGSLLTSFYVSCDKDRIVLTNVLKQFPEYSRITIITGKFCKKVYDVRNGMVRLNSNEGRSMLDVMKVSNPDAMNCLIDQKSIETIAFVDNEDIATNLTEDANNVPPNLSRVVMLKPYSEYYPDPNYRTYVLPEKPVRYIQTSFTDIIAGYDQQKKQLDEKLQHLAQSMKELQASAKEKELLIKNKRSLLLELQQKQQNYTKELNELTSFEYPLDDENEFLHKEVEILDKKLKALENKIIDSEQILEVEKADCAEKQEIMLKIRAETMEARNEMVKIQENVEKVQEQLNEMNNNIKLKSNQIGDLKDNEATQYSKIAELNEAIRVLSQKPSSDRVPSDRTDDEILKLIRTKEKLIHRIEVNDETLEDVELLLANKIQHIDKMKKTRDAFEQCFKMLENIRNSRFYYIKRLRQHMSLRLKHKFHTLMSLRQYDAEVAIDHIEKTLELKVIPRDSSVENAVSNTKSLSGGERSYSTVAFLISLWSCVDHPFYFLDEYDVFSDEHNRHVMTKLLFHEALNNKNKQYGFLTPQDFSNLQSSEAISIHKLQDPDEAN